MAHDRHVVGTYDREASSANRIRTTRPGCTSPGRRRTSTTSRRLGTRCSSTSSAVPSRMAGSCRSMSTPLARFPASSPSGRMRLCSRTRSAPSSTTRRFLPRSFAGTSANRSCCSPAPIEPRGPASGEKGGQTRDRGARAGPDDRRRHRRRAVHRADPEDPPGRRGGGVHEGTASARRGSPSSAAARSISTWSRASRHRHPRRIGPDHDPLVDAENPSSEIQTVVAKAALGIRLAQVV